MVTTPSANTPSYRIMTPADYADEVSIELGREVDIGQAYAFMRAGFLPARAATAIEGGEEP